MSKNVKWIALFVMIVAVTCAIVCVNGTFDNEQNNTDDDSTIPSVTPIPTPTTPEDPEEEEHSYMTTVYDSNNNEYTVSGGVLTIVPGASGTGVMPDFTSSSRVSHLVGQSFTSVVIGSGMTNVGAYAFYFTTTITSFTLADTVTAIGDYAFEVCTGLTGSISLPNITSLGVKAFDLCSHITSVTLGSGLTYLNHSIFENCSALTSAIIQGNVSYIGEGLFLYCSALTSVTFTSRTPATLASESEPTIFPSGATIYVPYGKGSVYRTAWSDYASQIVESPSTSNIKVNVNGTWKDGTVYVNVNGTWKEGTPYVNVNGTWKQGG